MRPLEIISARLQDVRGSRARCPACGKLGALSFRETSDKTVLLKCFRGCTAAEITAAMGLEVRALFVARTPIEHRDRAEMEARERQAYMRDPKGYLRGALRRTYVQMRQQQRRELGYSRPPRSDDIDRCRRRVAASVGISLHDVPAAIGWPLWGGSTTRPAPWEMFGCDDDPCWPSLFMRALDIELGRMRVAEPNLALDAIDDPWRTIPNALHRAALRARAAMRRLAVAGAREVAA